MRTLRYRSGMPFVLAALVVFLYAIFFGMSSTFGYVAGLLLAYLVYAPMKRLFPDRYVVVENLPKSKDPQVNKVIDQCGGELREIRITGNDIYDPWLLEKVDLITIGYRTLLRHLSEDSTLLRQLHAYLRYLMPTTSMLLKIRVKLQDPQKNDSPTAVYTRKRIDEALLAIEQSLEAQQAVLEEKLSLDVDVDIQMIKEMLGQSGVLGAQPTELIQALAQEAESAGESLDESPEELFELDEGTKVRQALIHVLRARMDALSAPREPEQSVKDKETKTYVAARVAPDAHNISFVVSIPESEVQTGGLVDAKSASKDSNGEKGEGMEARPQIVPAVFTVSAASEPVAEEETSADDTPAAPQVLQADPPESEETKAGEVPDDGPLHTEEAESVSEETVTQEAKEQIQAASQDAADTEAGQIIDGAEASSGEAATEEEAMTAPEEQIQAEESTEGQGAGAQTPPPVTEPVETEANSEKTDDEIYRPVYYQLASSPAASEVGQWFSTDGEDLDEEDDPLHSGSWADVVRSDGPEASGQTDLPAETEEAQASESQESLLSGTDVDTESAEAAPQEEGLSQAISIEETPQETGEEPETFYAASASIEISVPVTAQQEEGATIETPEIELAGGEEAETQEETEATSVASPAKTEGDAEVQQASDEAETDPAPQAQMEAESTEVVEEAPAMDSDPLSAESIAADTEEKSENTPETQEIEALSPMMEEDRETVSSPLDETREEETAEAVAFQEGAADVPPTPTDAAQAGETPEVEEARTQDEDKPSLVAEPAIAEEPVAVERIHPVSPRVMSALLRDTVDRMQKDPVQAEQDPEEWFREVEAQFFARLRQGETSDIAEPSLSHVSTFEAIDPRILSTSEQPMLRQREPEEDWLGSLMGEGARPEGQPEPPRMKIDRNVWRALLGVEDSTTRVQ